MPKRESWGASPLGSSFLLYALAPLTVTVVGFALLVGGAERPYAFARLYGGPTDGAGPWTGRVQLLERRGEFDSPVEGRPLRVSWHSGDHTTAFRGTTGPEGWLDVVLKRPPGADGLHVVITSEGSDQPLAEGAPELPRSRWQAAARRQGGSIEGRTEGALAIRAWVRGGVMAVPFSSVIELTVREGAEPASGVELRFEPEGMFVDSTTLRTDSAGRARLRATPEQHYVALGVTARRGGDDLVQGRWYSTLPVVPGALRAELRNGKVSIQSPVPRARAFLTWVSRTERLGSGAVALAPGPKGSSVGVLAFPSGLDAVVPGREGETKSTWLVVSTSPDGRSPSTVGWPLGDQARTFDALDASLLDGAPLGERRERKRLRRVQWLVGLYCFLATVLAVTLLAGRVRRAGEELDRRLREAGASDGVLDLRLPRYRLVLALLCVALGFTVFGLIALARVG